MNSILEVKIVVFALQGLGRALFDVFRAKSGMLSRSLAMELDLTGVDVFIKSLQGVVHD